MDLVEARRQVYQEVARPRKERRRVPQVCAFSAWREYFDRTASPSIQTIRKPERVRNQSVGTDGRISSGQGPLAAETSVADAHDLGRTGEAVLDAMPLPAKSSSPLATARGVGGAAQDPVLAALSSSPASVPGEHGVPFTGRGQRRTEASPVQTAQGVTFGAQKDRVNV